MGLHIGRRDRLAEDLLDAAAEALAEHGASEHEQEQLKRDVVEALVLDSTESIDSAALRILRQHRRAA